jgi:hypothetical protein
MLLLPRDRVWAGDCGAARAATLPEAGHRFGADRESGYHFFDPTRPGGLVATRSIMLSVLAAAVALSGCAGPRAPASLKDTVAAAPAASPPQAAKNLDCAGRHLDREAGRPPAGATTLEQKRADDRVCGEEYRYPGYLKAP